MKIFPMNEADYHTLDRSSGGICLTCGMPTDLAIGHAITQAPCSTCGALAVCAIRLAYQSGRITFDEAPTRVSGVATGAGVVGSGHSGAEDEAEERVEDGDDVEEPTT